MARSPFSHCHHTPGCYQVSVHSHFLVKIIPFFFLWFFCNTLILAQNWNQLLKVSAFDRGAGDQFGYSVSISGNYAIIGAWSDDEDASGANTMSNAGSAYLFERDAFGNWTQKQKIVATDRTAGDFFGESVSTSENYAIVGAYINKGDANGANPLSNAGAVYIFERGPSGIWLQKQKVVASDRAIDDFFGLSVGISGNYAIVGAHGEDQDAKGNNTLSYAGSAYIFERDALGKWSQQQKIVASDRALNDEFGLAVSISDNCALIGSFPEDEDANGLNTMASAGSAYLFERDNTGLWIQKQKIVASDRATGDRFGYSVSISANYAIIGATREDEDSVGANTITSAGAAYIFERSCDGIWAEKQKIVASDRDVNDGFGISVSISGTYAIAGAWFHDLDTNETDTLSNAGTAYIFERNSSGRWFQKKKIVPIDRGIDDRFGLSVCLSGNTALVGSPQDNENMSGDDSLLDAGSSYLFNGLCTLPDIPVIEANNASICSGQNAILSIGCNNLNGASYWQWYNLSCGAGPIGRGASININPTITTTYYLRGEGGCVTPGSCSDITINVNTSPSVIVIPDAITVCTGDSITLAGSGATNYLWSPQNNLSATTGSLVIFNAVATGVQGYTLTGRDSNGCISLDESRITVVPNPTINAGVDITIHPGTSASIVAMGGSGNYLWSPAERIVCVTCSSTVVMPFSTITYTVTITDLNHCVGIDDLTIYQEIPCGEIFIPTAFSPNGDGKNDTLFVRGNPKCFEEFEFVIFNRWGEKVFTSNNFNKVWDGTSSVSGPMNTRDENQREVLNSEIFFYYLSVVSLAKPISLKGNISLIR